MLQPRIKPFRKGDKISADHLNEIVDAVLRQIHGGEGINVKWVGNRLIIEQKTNKQIVPQ